MPTFTFVDEYRVTYDIDAPDEKTARELSDRTDRTTELEFDGTILVTIDGAPVAARNGGQDDALGLALTCAGDADTLETVFGHLARDARIVHVDGRDGRSVDVRVDAVAYLADGQWCLSGRTVGVDADEIPGHVTIAWSEIVGLSVV